MVESKLAAALFHVEQRRKQHASYPTVFSGFHDRSFNSEMRRGSKVDVLFAYPLIQRLWGCISQN
jgi:hypothetical protein